MSEVTVTLTRLEVEHFLEDAPRDNGHDYLLDDRCLYCAPLIRKMKAAYTEQGSPEVCADCKGDGESWTEYGGVCPTCHGTGTVETGPQTSDEDAGTGNGPVSGGDTGGALEVVSTPPAPPTGNVTSSSVDLPPIRWAAGDACPHLWAWESDDSYSRFWKCRTCGKTSAVLDHG